jgi:hypothetical protein
MSRSGSQMSAPGLLYTLAAFPPKLGLAPPTTTTAG